MIVRLLVAGVAFALITYFGIDLLTPDPLESSVDTISLDTDNASDRDRSAGRNGKKSDDNSATNNDGRDETGDPDDEPEDQDPDDDDGDD